jgi:acetyl esterase
MRTIEDVLGSLTPAMRAVLDTQTRLSAELARPGTDLATLRANYTAEHRYWSEGGPAMVRTVDRRVAGVAVREHHPVPGASDRIVYLHGGGFVLGDLDSHDRIMRELAHRSGAVVVGVDYTLSPEAKFPRAIQEAAEVVRVIAAECGVPVGLAGDSGGATLALATALYLRDGTDGTPCPALGPLLLWYGMYGLRDSVSRRLLGGPWDGLTPEDLAAYQAWYTADPADLDSPYLDLLSADLSGLPPVYLAATDLDPLLDDSTALARLLALHGVEHRYEVFTGVLHAFLHCSRDLPEARTALDQGATFHIDHRKAH